MTMEITVVIGVLSLVIAYLTYQLNKSKSLKSDTKESAKDSAELRAELGYIRKGVDDIRIDLKANEKNIAHLSERVTRVEESSKQAHKRIDTLEKGDVAK
ncbi:hypothetical protein J9303_00855 [Bacillaceae bacterium Marseille-Q3522]|nr:hypothetical protein [Bacillaceae bacterium Marseille-Q3522]